MLKRLQDSEEQRWQFSALAVMDGIVREPSEYHQIILLLHGYDERGRRIFRKLLPYLPENALILAPNGPFPLPRPKPDRVDFGYAWYFFDKHQRKYLINQDLPKSWLKTLVTSYNSQHLPLTIIGFSQGGYLAPLVGLEMAETKLVIGIGCQFRPHLLPEKIPFSLEAIHGEEDEVISSLQATDDLRQLKEKGIECGWHSIPATRHEINQAVGIKVQELLEKHGKRSL